MKIVIGIIIGMLLMVAVDRLENRYEVVGTKSVDKVTYEKAMEDFK